LIRPITITHLLIVIVREALLGSGSTLPLCPLAASV